MADGGGGGVVAQGGAAAVASAGGATEADFVKDEPGAVEDEDAFLGAVGPRLATPFLSKLYSDPIFSSLDLAALHSGACVRGVACVE